MYSSVYLLHLLLQALQLEKFSFTANESLPNVDDSIYCDLDDKVFDNVKKITQRKDAVRNDVIFCKYFVLNSCKPKLILYYAIILVVFIY